MIGRRAPLADDMRHFSEKMMKAILRLMPLAIAMTLPISSASPQSKPGQAVWSAVAGNADAANDALQRCRRLVDAWYQQTGKGNALLPQNLNSRIWTAENSASCLRASIFPSRASVLPSRARQEAVASRTVR